MTTASPCAAAFASAIRSRSIESSELAACPTPVSSVDLRASARSKRSTAFLTWAHWLWFLEPYCALAFILIRRTRPLPPRRAPDWPPSSTSAAPCYFAAPTAPPWWSSEQGLTGEGVRRIMVEVGEETWGSAWPGMYGALGGNPWAAMPSLHFATSLTMALALAEAGPLEGAVGWGYALDTRLRPRLPGRALRHRSARRRRCWSSRCGAAEPSRRAAGRSRSTRCLQRLGAPRERVASSGCLRRTRSEAADANASRLPLLYGATAGADGDRRRRAAGRHLLPLPEAGRPRRRAEQARRSRPGLDRHRDRLQHRLLRHLHRPLQGGRRRRRAAPHLDRDLRDQHGRRGGDAALLGRRGGRDRAHLLGAAQGGDGTARRGPPDGRLHHPPLRLLPARADRLRRAAADRRAERQATRSS